MNWINFKVKYLFSLNFAIMLSIVLYGIRKDFTWHPVIGIWFFLCLFSPKLREIQKNILKYIGIFNSTVLFTVFYLVFFTPFSFIYKMAFRNQAFKKASSRLHYKKTISKFEEPF